MKNLALYITATLLVAFFSSCSEDSTTSPSNNNGTGLPLAVGNTWEYQTFDTDENGNTIGAVLDEYALTIVGKANIAGKEAFLITDNSDESLDSIYMYSDNSGLYSYDEPEETGSIGIWIKIIDFKNTKWDIYKVDIDEVDEEEGTTTKGVTGMKGERIASSKVTYKGKSYDVENYQNINYSELVITYLDENDELVTETVSESDTTQISLIPGLGIYSSTSLEVEFTNEGLEFTKQKDILVNHNLK